MPVRIKNYENTSTNVRINVTRQLPIRFLIRLLWTVSPAMAVGFVKKHIFSPTAYKTSRKEKQILDSGTEFQTAVNGNTIRGWQWGTGSGVLLVHGWNGRGIQFHRFFQPLLRAGCSVVTFDGPGHGESDGNTSSYFELTDAVRNILDPQQGFNINAVIGHSLGGAAIINALVKEKLTMPAVLIAPALRLREILCQTFDRVGIPAVVYQKAIEEYEQRFGYSLLRDNPVRLLPAIQTEVLIVHDRHDRTIPFRDSSDSARILPQVNLKATEGLGHRRIMGDRSISNWVAGHVADLIRPHRSPPGNHHVNRLIAKQENIMESHQHVVETYRRSDSEQRLSIYLDNPDLRTALIEIELETYRNRKAIGQKAKKGHVWGKKALAWAISWFKPL